MRVETSIKSKTSLCSDHDQLQLYFLVFGYSKLVVNTLDKIENKYYGVLAELKHIDHHTLIGGKLFTFSCLKIQTKNNYVCIICFIELEQSKKKPEQKIALKNGGRGLGGQTEDGEK